MTPNISYKFEKQLKRDGVFSQKNKNNSKNKNLPIRTKRLGRDERFCMICLSSSRKGRKTPIR
jgi:hypothetical protein